MSTAEMVVAQPLLPMDPGNASEVMRLYQETTRAWLDRSDWIGEPGADDSFVKRSGWDKIATAYNLSTEVISERVERDESGKAIRAHCVVRALSPSGRYRDGTGGCGINEPRFIGRGGSGAQKVEHDLPATAETRATNRAISKLVGFGAVSAEEVDADVRAGASAAARPEWAIAVPEGELLPTANQLREIIEAMGADPTNVRTVGTGIRDYCGGAVPRCVAFAIAAIHAALGSADAESEDLTPSPDARETEMGGESS
jgi:hypothetical protein